MTATHRTLRFDDGMSEVVQLEAGLEAFEALVRGDLSGRFADRIETDFLAWCRYRADARDYRSAQRDINLAVLGKL